MNPLWRKLHRDSVSGMGVAELTVSQCGMLPIIGAYMLHRWFR